MVEIEVVENEPEAPVVEEILPSEERLLDAAAIEKAAAGVDRPTARLQLEALAKKLRKESEALKRIEASKKVAAAAAEPSVEEKKEDKPEEKPAAAAVSPKPAAPPMTTATPAAAAAAVHHVIPSSLYKTIDRFAFDAGSGEFVSLYVDLTGVGAIPRDKITCDFTKGSFDLIVKDLKGKSYRLFRDNLEKDINVERSKIVVKANKIIVKLAKTKTDYGGFEYWSKLTDKKKGKKDGGKNEDPQASIMQLMKDMYDDGDDNMRKVIGETMLKQRNGELGKDGGMGGMPGLDGM